MKKRILYASAWALIALVWMFLNHQGGMEGIQAGETFGQILKTAYGTWGNALKGIIPAVLFFIVRYRLFGEEQEKEKQQEDNQKRNC